MIELEGWRSPGRGVHETLHKQMYGIILFLKDQDKINNELWGPPLQRKIGSTIGVNEASTVRHIIGFMKSVGIIGEEALESRKVPDADKSISESGNLLFSLIKLELVAMENDNKELQQKVLRMLKHFYANAFIYWYARDSKVHVARTVLSTIKKFGYIDKIEWFILNSFVTETDDKQQEELVENYINGYRAGDLKLSMQNVKKNINSYNYWTQILSYAGLIRKIDNKIYLGQEFPELVEAMLEKDFLLNLDVTKKYHLKM